MHPVLFVSLGPGDPELITIQSLKALQSADCIYYPSTISKLGKTISRAWSILSALQIDSDKCCAFDVPMSKDRTAAKRAYESVAELVKIDCETGAKIVVVAEGDVNFYSSVHYILDHLQTKDIEVKTLAGIPAFVACGALSAIHIAKQEEELNVVPGVISADDLRAKIEAGHTVAIMKVSQCQDAVKYCINTCIGVEYHYYENVGLAEKEYYTQDKNEILARTFPYFSLMIIRK